MVSSLKWLSRFKLISLAEIDSTNSEAKRMALEDKDCGYKVIFADKQTDGRGRYSREWDSGRGNLHFSVILPKTATLDIMAQLSFVSSLAVESALYKLLKKYNKSQRLELKWPNDVLLENKKIAGILLETAGKNNEYVVVGIGLNIIDTPILKEYQATSLHDCGIHFISAKEMMNKVMVEFLEYYNKWLSCEFMPIRKKWIKKAKGIGQIIIVNIGGNRISGKFIDIDFKGAVRLQVASGQIHSMHAGEVFFS